MRTEALDAKTMLAVYIIHFWHDFYRSKTPSGTRRTSLLDARKYLEPRLRGDLTPSGESLHSALVWWDVQVKQEEREKLLREYHTIHAVH